VTASVYGVAYVVALQVRSLLVRRVQQSRHFRIHRGSDELLLTHRAQSRPLESRGFFSQDIGAIMGIYSTLLDQCDPYVLFLSRSSFFFRSRILSTYNCMIDRFRTIRFTLVGQENRIHKSG
jgi:hypothetical protein